MGENGEQEEGKKEPASEMDDESLFDRLFPDELVEWIKDKFGKKDEEEAGEE